MLYKRYYHPKKIIHKVNYFVIYPFIPNIFNMPIC